MLIAHLHPQVQGNILSEFCTFAKEYGFAESGPGLQFSTIVNKLNAIKWFHNLHGSTLNDSDPSFKVLLQGLKRSSNTPSGKHPVSLTILEAVYQNLDLTSLRDQALWGIILLSYFFLLRTSEIAWKSKNNISNFALRGKDLIVQDKLGHTTYEISKAERVTIHLRGAKNDQEFKGSVRSLTKSGHTRICPVLGALWIINARSSRASAGLNSGPPGPLALTNGVMRSRTRTSQASSESGLDPAGPLVTVIKHSRSNSRPSVIPQEHRLDPAGPLVMTNKQDSRSIPRSSVFPQEHCLDPAGPLVTVNNSARSNSRPSVIPQEHDLGPSGPLGRNSRTVTRSGLLSPKQSSGPSDPLASVNRNLKITTIMISRVLKQGAKSLNLDQNHYSSHAIPYVREGPHSYSSPEQT